MEGMHEASKARLGRLRKACADEGIGAFLARSTSDIAWLTAFDGVFDDEPAHALYVCPHHAWLHTDSRYAAACEAAAADGPIRVSTEKGGHAAWAAGRFAERPAQAADALLGLEDSIELREYRALQRAFVAQADADGRRDGAVEGGGASSALQEPGAHDEGAGPAQWPFKETDGLVLGLRAVKDPMELTRMREAQAITDAAFSHIIGFMEPGMTEKQVQLELDGFMLHAGADGLAFPSIVAAGANGANPHAVPGDALLEVGQCVVMDFGARAHGYCSDMTRTVFLGDPEGEMLRAWEVLRQANERVQAFIRPGVTGSECHELAERVLAEGGFEGAMGHGLGHGVGLDIHELPVLSPRNPKPLVAGNVVTVEPGIYLPGRFGMRLEDCGVVTEDGFAPFTQSTHEPVVIGPRR